MDALKQLIMECLAGNRLSQAALYKLLAPRLFAVCLRYARSREEAEDILQEGFVQLFKSLPTFRHAGSLEGWARKIILGCAIRQYRKLPKIYPVIHIEAAKGNSITYETATAQLSKKELLKMVQALPPVYRLVFNLYVFDGFKHREIAALLGIAEGTSKSNLYEAKLLLQRAVAQSLRVATQNYSNG